MTLFGYLIIRSSHLELMHSLSPIKRFIEELAHAVMEPDKSQDLQSASWRRVDDVNKFWSESGSLETQKANVSVSICVPGEGSQAGVPTYLQKDQCFLFHSGLPLIEWGPPMARNLLYSNY